MMRMGSLRNVFAETVRSWARRRQGADSSPLSLLSRRIYILPSSQGLVFALLLFGMLLGAMNYNNNLGFAVTFLLSGLGLVSMYHCHRNLVGLQLSTGSCEPVFAGEQAYPGLIVENTSDLPRLGIAFALEDGVHAELDLAAGERALTAFEVAAQHRGRVRIGRFSVASRYPFALFRTWTWVHLNLECIVYPRPAENPPEPPVAHTDTGGAQRNLGGDEDFAGLRDYRPGDPPRHIAWKAFARGNELLVRQYAGTSVINHVFELEKVPARELENRLSILCRWMLDAHKAGEAFGLRMPGVRIEPAVGVAHLERCLRHLALFGIDEQRS